MDRRILVIAASALLLASAPPTAKAQVLRIEPELVDSSSPVEDALQNNQGRASTTIQGKGGMLAINYSSSETVEIFAAPLDTEDQFVPTDFLHFRLSPGSAEDVVIDLMGSPGWRPTTQRWLIHLLSPTVETQASFNSLAFIPASEASVVTAGFRHLFASEPYTPSSYHALRGYRIMNVSVSMTFGILLLVGVALALLLSKKKFEAVLLVVLAFAGLYQLRFSIDLLRFTHEHLSGYRAGLYDEAGSVYQIAGKIRELATTSEAQARGVYVCRDGTNYKEKLLRYMSYPIRISSLETDAGTAEFALVMDRGIWEYAPSEDKGAPRNILRCEGLWREATKIKQFPDGSTLFSLQP